jgi:signal transduction histidine kinase
VRWWRRAGVHVRSTVVATVVLAMLMALASGLLALVLQRSLTQGIDSTGRARAAAIAAQVRFDATGRLEDPSGELRSAIHADSARRSWIQVLDRSGKVLAASADVSSQRALETSRPASGKVRSAERGLPFDDDPYLVVARGGTAQGHPFTVVVGQSLGSVEASEKTLLELLAVGVPLLLIVLGFGTYWFAVRSLRPVEAIRRTVASINNHDLSERVEVPPADDAVSRLARTMNEMLERLELAQRAQRQFVADASHELRSPIATLAATAEVVLAYPEDADRKDFPVTVLEESRRLQRLVADLLTLARADERGLRPTAFRDVDLDDIVDAERHRVAALGGLAVEAHISPVRVAADQHQLQQVVRNLVDNAVAHAHSRVELSLYRSGPEAVIEIFNDGSSIEPDDRERIFERFVRLDESRARASGGTGLGLAIVREIVTAHSGTVTVVDDDGGTRFRVTLPADTPLP